MGERERKRVIPEQSWHPSVITPCE